MSLYILDTDTLSLFHQGHFQVGQRLLMIPYEDLALTVITVEESISGWYTQLRRAKSRHHLASVYLQLADTIQDLGRWRILSYTESAMDRYDFLKSQRLGVAAADLRIAAIVLEHGGTLVSRNQRDFQRIPELSLTDWSK